MSTQHEILSQERKSLQQQGLVPEWYSTQSWQMFKSRYMVSGEKGVKERFENIAKQLARHLPVKYRMEYTNLFFNLMWTGILSPSSPVLANTATDRGCSVSCSGQYIGDSVDSFYGNLHETAMLSKNSFGTSGYFGDIRPRGSDITGGGKATGLKPVVDDFFTCASKISHGGMRRGSFAAYVPVDHPDFDECISELSIDHKDKNYGWVITDEFASKLKSGEPEATRKWKEILKIKLLTGKGYLFFPDKANRHRPESYVSRGLDVNASNLCCVSGDQRVVTDKGLVTVKELYEMGCENLVVGMTGVDKASAMLLPRPNAPMVEINTSQGYSHKVTPDHRVWKKGHGWIEAQDLIEGDEILIQQVEGLFGSNDNLDLAFLMGLIAGDGTYSSHSVLIDLWEGKNLNLMSEIEDMVERLISNENLNTSSTLKPTFGVTSDGKKARLSSAPLAMVLNSHGFNKETKLVVPELIWKGTKETVGKYLEGLYLADGTMQSSADVSTLSLSSVNKKFLQEIQILWANFGVKSSLSKMRDEGTRDFGEKGGGEYRVQTCYRLLITSVKGCKIAEDIVGLTKYRSGNTVDTFKRNLAKKGYKQKMYATFTGIKTLPNEDAYCLTVDSETHAWTVNGMITHNTEIMLHSSEEYSYSCILSSLNLLHWDKIKDSNAVFVATVFLDCLCSEFIEQAKGEKGLEKVVKFTEKGRAVGLGTMGFATYLQSKMIPYESLEAYFLNMEIWKHIHDESLRASQWLATILGEPEWCEGLGVRNTHRTASAPTKSTAGLMGGMSESTFPDPAMVFTAGSAAGELDRIPPQFLKLLKEKGKYTKEVIENIVANNGSVQQLDFLSDHEKLVFKNAFEIDQWVIFRMSKARQKYICQGQSLNFFIAENENTETLLSDLMSACVLDEDILSQYYIYTRSGVVISGECVACSA